MAGVGYRRHGCRHEASQNQAKMVWGVNLSLAREIHVLHGTTPFQSTWNSVVSGLGRPQPGAHQDPENPTLACPHFLRLSDTERQRVKVVITSTKIVPVTVDSEYTYRQARALCHYRTN